MSRFDPAQSQDARTVRLLETNRIDTVLDVGANDGGYGSSLRNAGFKGNILSFEPLEEAHRVLVARAAKDHSWTIAPRMALGATDGQVGINVASNSTSSSILPMGELHIAAAPDSRYTHVQHVDLRRLDGIEHSVISRAGAIHLKIDTQGLEMAVLQGAERLLPRVRGLQVEMSLVPLYEGQVLYREMLDWVLASHFQLHAVIPGFLDKSSGRMLQMDGVFFRELTGRSGS